MELKIQAIHFDVTEKLHAFIEKKVAKLGKNVENIVSVDVDLKVVKPETAMNKEVQIHVAVPGGAYHADKVCDTFEEGVDLCVDVLLRQLDKYKEKQRGK